jgi:hypothetical protein
MEIRVWFGLIGPSLLAPDPVGPMGLRLPPQPLSKSTLPIRNGSVATAVGVLVPGTS